MPAQKVCSQPGCPELTDSQYCSTHTVHGWGSSTRQHPKGWQRTRRRVLRRDHFSCRLCGEQGNTVDHYLPMAWGGSENESNLRALCHSCHKAKTLDEARLGRGRGRMSATEWAKEVGQFLDRWIA